MKAANSLGSGLHANKLIFTPALRKGWPFTRHLMSQKQPPQKSSCSEQLPSKAHTYFWRAALPQGQLSPAQRWR